QYECACHHGRRTSRGSDSARQHDAVDDLSSGKARGSAAAAQLLNVDSEATRVARRSFSAAEALPESLQLSPVPGRAIWRVRVSPFDVAASASYSSRRGRWGPTGSPHR